MLAGRPPAANVLFGDLLDTPGELVTDHQPAAEALDVPTANGHAGYDQQADQWVLTYAFPLDGRDLDFGDDYEVLPADEYVGVLSAAYDV